MAYHAGASYSFGGFDEQQGGFMQSPTGVDSPNSESPSKKGGHSGAMNQSLTPVTIRQLLTATQQSSEDIFRVDGCDLHQITIVGQIVSMQQQSTNVVFVIDDSSGKIVAKIWLSSESQNDYMLQRSAKWRDGVYVRIIGSLRQFNSERNIVIFRIHPVEDFNEIAYHGLEVIHTHLFRIKKITTLSSAYGTTGNVETSKISAYQQRFSNQQQSYASPIQELNHMVLTVIRNFRNPPEGISVQLISKQLGKPENDIREIIDFLQSEGHIYMTNNDCFRLSDGQDYPPLEAIPPFPKRPFSLQEESESIPLYKKFNNGP